MSIINSSANPYGASSSGASFGIALSLSGDLIAVASDQNIDAEFGGAVRLAGDLSAVAYDPNADADFASAPLLAGDLAAQGYTPGDDDFFAALNLSGAWSGDTALILTDPPPITPTVSPGAFANQFFAAPKLFINNVSVPFISAEINAPAKNIGKSLAVELAKTDLAQLPENAVFRLEIYQRVAGVMQTFSIIADGKLASRNFKMTSGRDGLNISIVSATSRLDKYPVNNLIVYDASKTQISAEEIEPLPTNTGEQITTTARGVNVLTLYKLLKIAFVEGAGFASVTTDIPNFEIARCDFPVTTTYQAAVAQFIGVYEPDFVVTGNVLSIQKTINPLPPNFTPNSIVAAVYPNFSEQAQNSLNDIDGFILQYAGAAGSAFVHRNLPVITEPSGGVFGDADFTETTIRRKMRDWFEPDNPGEILRSELKEEIRETRRGGILVGREVQTNNFDSLGRGKGSTKTIAARMPDVAQDGAPSLLTTREEAQTIAYKSNPFAPRQTVQSRVETSVRGLLALDGENTALDEFGVDAPYAQDYERVYEAGNLKKAMTSNFAVLETTVENFRPLKNGQVEVRVTRFDALRGKLKPAAPSEVRSGDISVPNFQKQKSKTIFKVGVTQAARSRGLLPLNVGELPLRFAEPLAAWRLANPPVLAQIECAGYDDSIERGVFFALKGRTAESLGNFKIQGYRISIRANSIATTLEILKV